MSSSFFIDYRFLEAPVIVGMMNAIRANELGITVTKWIARVLVLMVFFLLGAFFVEHTKEWFIDPRPLTPPVKVWVGHGLHFLILAGLLISLRWPPAGAAITVCAALVFFGKVAGNNWPIFSLITCLPVLLLLFCWWRSRRPSNAHFGKPPV